MFRSKDCNIKVFHFNHLQRYWLCRYGFCLYFKNLLIKRHSDFSSIKPMKNLPCNSSDNLKKTVLHPKINQETTKGGTNVSIRKK